MAARKRSGARGDAAAIDALTDRVRQLTEELLELRRSSDREVRTRRLVVVEEDGFERIVAEGGGRFGQVTVYGRTPDGRSTCVELFVNDPVDANAAHAGMALVDGGE